MHLLLLASFAARGCTGSGPDLLSSRLAATESRKMGRYQGVDKGRETTWCTGMYVCYTSGLTFCCPLGCVLGHAA